MDKYINSNVFLRYNNKYFPLSPKLDFIKTCDNEISIIHNNYNYLLKKSKFQMLVDEKMKEFQKKKDIDLEKIILDKKLKLEKKRKLILKRHKLILSSYNNKMLLDMILSNKKFIKFITDKQKINIKNNKTETDLNKNNEFTIIPNKKNKIIYNITENNYDYYKNNIIFKKINECKTQNKTLNSEYYSTQNSDINSHYINKTYSKEENKKFEYKKNSKKNNYFPIASSLFPTSIPISKNRYLSSFTPPQKSVFSLRKNKIIKDKNNYNNYNKEYQITDINDYSKKNNIFNKNNLKIQKYNSNLINNKNKNKRSLLSYKKEKNKFKVGFLSGNYENKYIINNFRKRPLTSFNYKNNKYNNND